MRLSSSCCCSCRMRSSRFSSSPPPMNSKSATGPSLDARTTSRRVSSPSSLSAASSFEDPAGPASTASPLQPRSAGPSSPYPSLCCRRTCRLNEGSRAPRTEGSERVSSRIASPQTRSDGLAETVQHPAPALTQGTGNLLRQPRETTPPWRRRASALCRQLPLSR